jgi:hypothetical protein
MNPFAPDEYIDEKVSGRVARGRILKGATRPVYWAIPHENVLRIPVGGATVMSEQLEHVAGLARERAVVVQVLPYAAGAYPVMTGDLRLVEFEDAPSTAHTEAVYSGNLLDAPAVVKHAPSAYDLLRADALPPDASLALIESAAEGFSCGNDSFREVGRGFSLDPERVAEAAAESVLRRRRRGDRPRCRTRPGAPAQRRHHHGHHRPLAQRRTP